MVDKNQVIRRVHALAKEIWGEQEIAGEPAYIFWTRVWAKLRYGVEQRRELDITQWLEMKQWLEVSYRRLKPTASCRHDADRKSATLRARSKPKSKN